LSAGSIKRKYTSRPYETWIRATPLMPARNTTNASNSFAKNL